MEKVIILEDDEVLVKQKLKKAIRPNYSQVGTGTMNKHGIQSIDFIKEIVNSSKAAQFLILQIKDRICYGNDYNPVVQIRKKDLTPTQQQYLRIGYKELVEKDLVRRIKNGWYMINPNALIPLDYPAAVKIWNEAAERNKRSVDVDED